MTLSNKPAFPCGELSYPGLTFREYAAIAAMQGILTNPQFWTAAPSGNAQHDAMAAVAVRSADALIERLNQ